LGAVSGVAGLGVVAMTFSGTVPTQLGCVVAVAAYLWLLRRTIRRLPDAPVSAWREIAARFWGFAGFRAVGGDRGRPGADPRPVGCSAPWPGPAMPDLRRVDPVGGGRHPGAPAIRLVVAPQISGMLARREMDAAQQLHGVSTVGVLAFSGPFYALLAVFAAPVLSLLGPDFRQGPRAMVVLAAAMFVHVATGNVQTVLLEERP
jgi:hypothetical protein